MIIYKIPNWWNKLWQNNPKELMYRRFPKDVLRNCNDLHIYFVALPNADSRGGPGSRKTVSQTECIKLKLLLLPPNPRECDQFSAYCRISSFSITPKIIQSCSKNKFTHSKCISNSLILTSSWDHVCVSKFVLVTLTSTPKINKNLEA